MNIKPVSFAKIAFVQGNTTHKQNKNNPCSNLAPQANDCYSFSGKRNISRTDILETIDKSEPLSNEGFKGIVYKYDKGDKSYIIKIARAPEYKFNNEANILKQLPSDINCQRYVSYFQHPKSNCDILVSTFISGSKGVLKNTDDFNQFLNMLLQLDKAEILHGDLNMQNCLFGTKGIGLIDFGEGEVFNTGDTYDDFIYPNFVLKSNIVNLEHNGIPDCIKMWVKENDDTKEYFRNYLSAKSQYYEEHAEFLKTQNNNLSNVIDFEENYSKALKNPSDLIIENEIRRIDCLYSFENADTAVNYRNIPKSAIKIWNLTIQKAKEQLEFINKTLLEEDLSAEERKYFEYQKEIIELFYQQFNSWGSSTTKWLNSLTTKNNPSAFEKKFIANSDKEMELPPNLVSLIYSKN